MPTYAYACTECEHSFDIHQSFSDDSLTTCPECEGRLRKVFGNLGVTFSGSGFYRTDSRSGSSSSSGGAGGGASGASSASSKSESTSASTPASA
ncbi:MAG: FmdB family transcriptional regulator [Microbacteriaceae bacterium]|jgi:putative FmdB family regulatory protein|nr:FmdB family transcriptional regulator [Microbacteriaceae bacterium]HOA87365.1 zinc ribbon domain-containing protein [Microbacteriaceae bacterium]HQC92637.1 zinc ribbon domain-containing protein [Microbacteriaceae bacterium]